MTSLTSLDAIRQRVQASHPGGTYRDNLAEFVSRLDFAEGKFTSFIPGGSDLIPVILTDGGFKSLVKDRLGFGPAASIFEDASIPTNLKLELMRHKASSVSDTKVVIRTRGFETPVVEAVLSWQYSQIDNWDIVDELANLVSAGDLPDDLQAPEFALTDGGRYMTIRLVSRDAWTYEVAEEPYYGAMVIQNDEFGGSQFSVSGAIQRLACTNYAIGETLVSHQHRWDGVSEFSKLLRSAAGGITGAHDFMTGRMEGLRQIQVAYPEDMLSYMLDQLKVRYQKKVVARRAAQYLEEEGGDTAYDVIQAVTFATQTLSLQHGRSVPRWPERNRTEQEIWQMVGVNFFNLVEDGNSVDDIYMSGDLSLKDQVANLLRDKARGYEETTASALEEAAGEVLALEIE